ncbi:MAG: hypothetical protein KKB03_03800 [Nanoarchaeota archaeon]|nr:hypothetical protein [Nanoarchaeota archaeon]
MEDEPIVIRYPRIPPTGEDFLAGKIQGEINKHYSREFNFEDGLAIAREIYNGFDIIETFKKHDIPESQYSNLLKDIDIHFYIALSTALERIYEEMHEDDENQSEYINNFFDKLHFTENPLELFKESDIPKSEYADLLKKTDLYKKALFVKITQNIIEKLPLFFSESTPS